MEAFVSVICALAGLIFGWLFLRDFAVICSDYGGGGSRRWALAGIKLLIALLVLHFHFELDILD